MGNVKVKKKKKKKGKKKMAKVERKRFKTGLIQKKSGIENSCDNIERTCFKNLISLGPISINQDPIRCYAIFFFFYTPLLRYDLCGMIMFI